MPPPPAYRGLSKTVLCLIGTLLLQSAWAVDIKGLEVDFAVKLKTPSDAQCVQVTSQPRDGTTRFNNAQDQFIFTLKEGELGVAPAPGIVVRDVSSQLLIFHGTDAQGNNVLSVFSKTFDDLLVKKGQAVKRGDPLGKIVRAAGGYFSAMVSNNTDAQPFLDSVFQLARATNVPASYFLFPIRTTAGKSEVTDFVKFEPNQDYGDADWEKTKKFTGFTFPFACGASK